MTSHRDAALSQKVSVWPAVLEGENITSATSRALAFSVRIVAPVTRVSPDGVVFTEDTEGFQSELVTQVTELHNNRAGATLDVDLLRTGANFYVLSA